MKDLIYHKFRNSSIGGYFIRNGADVSEPIGAMAPSAEIEKWLREVIASPSTGIVKVSFEDDEKSEQSCGQDKSVMIPVHDWIWQEFKAVYPSRFDDDEDINNELIKIVHNWICRAMQYYIREGIEDPWTIMEAYEIAMECPDIHIKREHGAWTVEISHMFNVEAKNANELLRKVKASRDYIESPQPRSTRDIVREAFAIQGTCPAMVVEELMLGGWIICFRDNDYKGEAQDAEQLLRAVKLAKEYYEAAMENREKHGKAVKLDESEEEPVQDEDGVIRIDRLDHSIKRLLLHFIENLTIKQAMEILEVGNYPHIALDKLYDISLDLRLSLEKEEW